MSGVASLAILAFSFRLDGITRRLALIAERQAALIEAQDARARLGVMLTVQYAVRDVKISWENCHFGIPTGSYPALLRRADEALAQVEPLLDPDPEKLRTNLREGCAGTAATWQLPLGTPCSLRRGVEWLQPGTTFPTLWNASQRRWKVRSLLSRVS